MADGEFSRKTEYPHAIINTCMNLKVFINKTLRIFPNQILDIRTYLAFVDIMMIWQSAGTDFGGGIGG